MNKLLKSIVVLTVICATVSILLAVTNSITKPIITEQEKAATNKALAVVLTEGKNFETITISEFELPKTIIEAYKDKNAGYVFKIKVNGYKPDMIILCGIDNDGVVKGTKYFSGGETHPAKDTYGEKLLGKTIEDISSVDTISGSTMTSAAYKDAIKDALNSFIILNGGSVDLRDEAQILNDNLSAALPEAEGKFSPVFITEDIGDIEAVYSADNGNGFVFIIGEQFVATDKNGVLIGESDLKATVETAANAIINSKSEEIDITKYSDMPTQVAKAYKTTSGNYVFELKAAGFGINGDKYYNPSGEPIEIKVSATKDGKIISCLTVSQKESEGYGAACADEKFYSQFNGKTESDYAEIDAISGATITTNGYKTAVSKVFTAIKILEGVS